MGIPTVDEIIEKRKIEILKESGKNFFTVSI